MSFIDGDFQEVIDYPDDNCPGRLGGLLSAFPPAPLVIHERGGFRFQPPPCGEALSLDPDFCISEIKMDPNSWRPERDAILNAIQSAVTCSFGVSEDELRDEARDALEHNLSRAIEADLVAALAAEPGLVVGGTFEAKCVLAEAAMFLASQSECGTGIILGPTDWFTQLGKDHLIWNGTYHTDVNGNIVIGHSIDNNTVYAFDGGLVLKVSDVQLLDETMPGQRVNNDRVVRAEQLYAIAFAPCVIGSFTVSACCDCGGGGGGGGGVQNPCNCQFAVTNFPANQNVTVTNTVDVALQNPMAEFILCDDNGPFLRKFIQDETGIVVQVSNFNMAGNAYAPVGDITVCGTVAPVVRTKHKMASDVNPWTVADTTGTVTGITYTILSGTANVEASDFQIVAGLPAGLTATWNNDNEGELLPLLSVRPQAPGDQTYVNWTELV